MTVDHRDWYTGPNNNDPIRPTGEVVIVQGTGSETCNCPKLGSNHASSACAAMG